MRESWSGADRYEAFMGRWSRLVAEKFLGWLAPAAGLCWIDVGCGTGALTRTLAAKSPRIVVGADSSQDYVRAAREGTGTSNVASVVAEAQELPIAGESADMAVSALALNFVPQPERMVAEMRRALRRNGRIALYVWDYAGGMEFLRYFWDAVVELDPAAVDLDEGNRFPICNPTALEQLFVRAGLENVAVRAIDVPTPFKDFEDYWSPFLGGPGPAPGYVSTLASQPRSALRDLLRKQLPRRSDRSISLRARAWAVQGRKS